MAYVFIFNGPPMTGKDFFTDSMLWLFASRNLIKDDNNKYYKLQFKDKLFSITKEIYSIDDDSWDILYKRENKETPVMCLGGLSPRQALIHVSEDIIKPVLGDDYFGKQIVKRIANDYNGIYFISDGGFLCETLPLINDKSIDLTVFKLADGCNTYAQYGDIRGYLELSGYDSVREIEIFNNKTEDDVFNVYRIVNNIIKGNMYEK